jgi:hypothetical protein
MEFLIWLFVLPFLVIFGAIFLAGAAFAIPLLLVFGVPAFMLSIGAWPVAIIWLIGMGALFLRSA